MLAHAPPCDVVSILQPSELFVAPFPYLSGFARSLRGGGDLTSDASRVQLHADQGMPLGMRRPRGAALPFRL